jgi:sec-independent protein translocase protein TatA
MNIASLLNLGGPDLIVILFIVLILFGAKKLPELARGMGQAVKEFSKAKDEFEREVSRPPEPAPPVQQRLPSPPVDHAQEVAHDSLDPHAHDPHVEPPQESPHTTVI